MPILLILIILSSCAETKPDHLANYQASLANAATFCNAREPRWPENLTGWKDGCVVGFLKQCGPTYCPATVAL